MKVGLHFSASRWRIHGIDNLGIIMVGDGIEQCKKPFW
jgi:hypothetical protein